MLLQPGEIVLPVTLPVFKVGVKIRGLGVVTAGPYFIVVGMVSEAALSIINAAAVAVNFAEVHFSGCGVIRGKGSVACDLSV